MHHAWLSHLLAYAQILLGLLGISERERLISSITAVQSHLSCALRHGRIETILGHLETSRIFARLNWRITSSVALHKEVICPYGIQDILLVECGL